MPKVEKVTVSLPVALFAYVEDERARTGATRSETVASLLWRAKHAAELVEREEQYARAYAEQPETEAELAWSRAATAQAFADGADEWKDFRPQPTSRRHDRHDTAVDTPRRPETSRQAATRATS